MWFRQTVIFLLMIVCQFNSEQKFLPKLTNDRTLSRRLKALEGVCIDDGLSMEWWSYRWCHEKLVKQHHYDDKNHSLIQSNPLGIFIADESSMLHQIYRDNSQSCIVEQRVGKATMARNRYTEVTLECCSDMTLAAHSKMMKYGVEDPPSRFTAAFQSNSDVESPPHGFIYNVNEPEPCTYHITICSNLVCNNERSEKATTEKQHPTMTNSETTVPIIRSSASASIPTQTEQLELKERTRAMFYHAYHGYMDHAYPAPELKPISCTGGTFDLVKVPTITLIDTLDTLIILNDYAEFRHAVGLIVRDMPDFNLDVNVSVFESTIRLLGGLLSAHMMAIDPQLMVYEHGQYNNELLNLSIDLGERLLPAFNTKTGIPIGTVNLRYGVPNGETKVASLAGAGSLLIEFEVLSYLSGDVRYGNAAMKAAQSLYDHRSEVGLLGKHINADTGQWHESLSGIGSNSDSFYEYLLKAYLLFRRDELYHMFTDTYRAIKKFVQIDHWFTEVDMYTGRMQRRRVENLNAFWPGLEAMLGFTDHGAHQLNSFYSVWSDIGLLPEEFDFSQWQAGNGVLSAFYPLRPELIESTYHHYRTTGDRSWLAAGKMFLESIEISAKTKCGYASVKNALTMEIQDSMSSFFLSETCKYLYLLFDEDNFINNRPFIFSTEAHPFDAVQLSENDVRMTNTSTAKNAPGNVGVGVKKIPRNPGLDRTRLIHAPTNNDNDNNHYTSPQRKHKKSSISGYIESKIFNLLFPNRGKDSVSNHNNVLADVSSSSESTATSTKSNARTQRYSLEDLGLTLIIDLNANTRVVRSLDALHNEALQTLLPVKCMKKRWWDATAAYDVNYYVQEVKTTAAVAEKSKNTKLASVRKHNSKGIKPGMVEKITSARPTTTRSTARIVHRLEALIDAMQGWNEESGSWNNNSSSVETSTGATPSVTTTTTTSTATDASGNVVNKRPNTCYPSDQPKPLPPAVLDTQEVKVVVEPLGQFRVKIHADGFIVRHPSSKHTVEIQNLGRSIVMVREYSEDVAKVTADEVQGNGKLLMGNLTDATVASCRVKVTKTTAEKSSTLFDRQCSLANFGPLENSVTKKKLAIAQFNGGVLCKSIAAFHTSAFKRWSDWQAPDLPISTNIKRYPVVPVSKNTPMMLDEPVFNSVSSKPYRDHIIVGARGDCTFEEKAIIAQHEGASALIVKNSEDTLFIMAGKRDVDETLDPIASKHRKPKYNSLESPPVQQAIVVDQTEKLAANEQMEVSIPTVMMSKSDALALVSTSARAIVQSTNENIADLHTEIHITSQHMLLNSEYMGDYTYPKLWFNDNAVLLKTSSNWATYVTSAEGKNEWQLYILSKQDTSEPNLLPTFAIRTAGNQVKTTTATLHAKSVELYRNLIFKVCPTLLSMQQNRVVLKTKYT